MPYTTATALLTIRAWREDDPEHPLRVEMRRADDVADGYRTTVTTVHVDAVVEAVQAFLDSVLGSSPDEQSVTEVARPGDG